MQTNIRRIQRRSEKMNDKIYDYCVKRLNDIEPSILEYGEKVRSNCSKINYVEDSIIRKGLIRSAEKAKTQKKKLTGQKEAFKEIIILIKKIQEEE